MLAMMCCLPTQATNRLVTEKDSLGNKKRVIELRDTLIDGKTMTDTLSIMTYENSVRSGAGSRVEETEERSEAGSHGWSGLNLGDTASETIIAVTGIIFIFGMPLLIVFMTLFFSYKNRKANYRLAEQALASGQPLPEEFFKHIQKTEDIRTKGIKNVFVGIGLFIFLWAISGDFGLGCVGLLVMFTGFGQLVIHYTQNPDRQDSPEK